MKISVIIPIFKVEQYLYQCVDSVLSQTYSDLEVILVDDGSPDGCGKICDAYAERDCRVKVIHQENSGLSAARNAGIGKATGDYIIFLDGDDYWGDAAAVSQLAARLALKNADVLCFNYRKTYDSYEDPPYFLETIKEKSGGFEAVANEIWIACAWNKVIRRSLFDENDLYFIEGITSEDIDWCIRLALCADRFDYVNQCGVYYRQRQGSISNAMTVKKVDCLCRNILRSQKLARQAGGEKERLLQPYLAYQVGTLLQAISQLEGKEERRALTEDAKPLLPLLANSDNSKIRLLHRANRLAGVHGCIALLRLRSRLR